MIGQARRLRASVAETDPADLVGFCRVIAQDIGLVWCGLEVVGHGSGVAPLRASWPHGCREPTAGRRIEVVVHWHGQRIGVLAGRSRRRPRLVQRRVLADVAVVLGPSLQLARLHRRLRSERELGRSQAAQIAAGRLRALKERDDERHRLEQDLHDGAQPRLVTMRMLASVVQIDMQRGESERASQALRELIAELDEAEVTMLNRAAGLPPALLAEHGLGPALAGELGRISGVELVVDPAMAARRYPAPVETALFFTCLEAVTNARKHAPQAGVRVTVHADHGGLHFEIHDDGPGLTPPSPGDDAGPEPASGLEGMRRRIAEARGHISVQGGSGGGTAITGYVPW